MKPTILLDMDGPIADFDRHYWHIATHMAADHNIDHPFDIATLSEQTHRYLNEHLTEQAHQPGPHGGPSISSRTWTSMRSQHWYQSLPITEGAFNGVAELLAHPRIDLVFCSKPFFTNPWCRDQKARWLQKHWGDQAAHRLILAEEKWRVHGTILVDDAIPPTWPALATWAPVVFDMPFNRAGNLAYSPHEMGAESEPHWRWTWSDGTERLIERAMTLHNRRIERADALARLDDH